MLLRPRTPTHGDFQFRGDFAEVFERPAFLGATCEGVNHGEVFNVGRRDTLRNEDGRDAFPGRRERGEKREREMADGVAKFGAVRSVPGIDGVEGFQLRDARVFDHADQIQARIGDGSGAVGEADQRKQRARGPDFGIRRPSSFQGRKRKDDVADGARTDEQSTTNE
jgi:hypothetical protein